jgi:hypothetical protein
MRWTWIVPTAVALSATVLSVAFIGCSSNKADTTPADTGGEAEAACFPYNAGPRGPDAEPWDTWPLPDGRIPDPPPKPDVGPRVLRSEIDGILEKSCSFASCHGASPGTGSLFIPARISSDWYSNVVGPSSKENPKMKIVEPLDPEKSWIIHKLSGDLCAFTKDCTGGDCGKRMPNDNPALSPGDFKSIQEWIRQGAPQE